MYVDSPDYSINVPADLQDAGQIIYTVKVDANQSILINIHFHTDISIILFTSFFSIFLFRLID